MAAGAGAQGRGAELRDGGCILAALTAFFALHGLFLDTYYFAPVVCASYGAPVDRPAVLLVATVLLLFSVLHALPPHRSRARLGFRVALTLAVLAFVIRFPLVRIEGYGVVGVAALLVLALLCANHSFDRRRALRSLDAPVDWGGSARRRM